MYQSRCWGQSLKETGGNNSKAVKKLKSTLKDARAASEIALRRTAIEALVPAAAVGNRGALAAQAKALGDEEEVVRRTALKALQKAAGDKRAESGGAVAVALAEALPQFSVAQNTDVRRSAADALARLAPQQDKELAKIAVTWVNDEDPVVRASATQALGLAGSGREALDALKQSMADVDWRVSQEACLALTKLAKAPRKKEEDGGGSSKTSSSGSKRSQTGGLRPRTKEMSAALMSATTPAEVLAECCRSDLLRGLPRVNAVKALGKAAKPGDTSAVLVAAHQLTDVDFQVRRAAVGALRHLAPGDRKGTIRAAASQLTNFDFRARESASEALAAISEGSVKSSDTAFQLAASTLEGEDWRGRRGAASALRRLGQLDGGAARDSVFAVLIPRLEHPDWSIRRKAAQALGVVAKGVGDVRAIKLLAGLARDPDEEVRVAVVAALPGAAPPKKCKEAIQMAATFAADSNPRIRVAALKALKELASVERSRSRVAVHAVSACIKDEVEEVRLTAEHVMKAIAAGRRTSIDDIALRLSDPDEEVRKAAVEAFAGCGPGKRERALKRAVPLLRHEDPGVRKSVVDAMAGMTNPEEGAAIAAAASAVARFRRRFAMPAGYADWDDDQKEEYAAGPTADDPARAAYEEGVAQALLHGDLQLAADLEEEEKARLAEEEKNKIKEDTDTESELSESGTDEDTEPEDGNDQEQGSRLGSDTASDVTGMRSTTQSFGKKSIDMDALARKSIGL